jgi:hypothetical protein
MLVVRTSDGLSELATDAAELGAEVGEGADAGDAGLDATAATAADVTTGDGVGDGLATTGMMLSSPESSESELCAWILALALALALALLFPPMSGNVVDMTPNGVVVEVVVAGDAAAIEDSGVEETGAGDGVEVGVDVGVEDGVDEAIVVDDGVTAIDDTTNDANGVYDKADGVADEASDEAGTRLAPMISAVAPGMISKVSVTIEGLGVTEEAEVTGDPAADDTPDDASEETAAAI